MHDINKIRNEADFYIQGWRRRGIEVNLDKILELDKSLRKSITDLQGLQTQRNDLSKQFGVAKKNNDKDIFILPGPPREFIPLVEDEIVPFLKNNFESTNKDYEFIMFYNQAESALAQQIDTFKPENLDIAYLASKGIIKLRYDKNSVNSKDLIEFKKNIKNTLSDDILSTENIPASKVLLNILNENELTLSLVESITEVVYLQH